MSTEYFIRHPDSEEATGPYSIEKLLTLAEAGKVTEQTLYYDEAMASWVLIAANDDLKAQVFPQKKRLSLRSKAQSSSPVEEDEDEYSEEDPNAIESVIAAAEGTSKETRYLKELQKWRIRTAAFSPPLIAVILLGSAASLIWPSLETVQTVLDDNSQWPLLLQKPYLILGAFDLLAAVAVFLRATEIYPFVRFRALFGSGFMVSLYLSSHLNGDPTSLYLVLGYLGFGFGLAITTMTLNFRWMVSALITAAVGLALTAWFGSVGPLLQSLLNSAAAE